MNVPTDPAGAMEGPEETLRVGRSIDVGGSCLKIRWFAGEPNEDTPIRVQFQRKVCIFYAQAKPPNPASQVIQLFHWVVR